MHGCKQRFRTQFLFFTSEAKGLDDFRFSVTRVGGRCGWEAGGGAWGQWAGRGAVRQVHPGRAVLVQRGRVGDKSRGDEYESAVGEGRKGPLRARGASGRGGGGPDR